MNRLDAALGYARSGWKIFPLHSIVSGACTCGRADCTGRSRGKHPRVPSGSKQATTDEDQVRKWWTQWPDANIGFVAGAYCDVLILDVDGDKGGQLVLDALQDRHEPLPRTRTVKTGNGLHLYFRFPWHAPQEDLPPRSGLVDLDGSELAGLDLRAGGNGYVLLPDSIHYSGVTYQWQPECGEEVAECPDWLWRILTEGTKASAPAPKAPPPPSRTSSGDPMQRYMEKALAGACGDLSSVGRGSEAHRVIHDTAHRFGGYVGAGHLDEDRVVQALTAAAAASGKPHRDVAKTVADGVRTGKLKPVTPVLAERVCREDAIQLRTERPGLTSSDAARVLGVPAATIRRWWHESKAITPDQEGGDRPDQGGDRGGDRGDQGAITPGDRGGDRAITPGVIDHLADIAKRLELANDASERDGILPELLAVDLVRDLAEARAKDASAGVVELSRIARIRGTTKVLQAMEKAVAKAKKSRGPDSVKVSLGTPLAEALGELADDLDGIDELRVPFGYALSDRVYAVELDKEGSEISREVCRAPLFVAGEAVDVDGAGTSWDVRWHDGRAWRRRQVPRGVALVARSLAELAQHGLPVSSASAPDIVRYLEAFDAENGRRFPRRSTSLSLGWRDDTFLLGAEVLHAEGAQADVELDLGDPGMAQLVRGYHQGGTWEGWKAAVARLTPYPRVILALAAACVPPLYKYLPEAPNFIVEWAGKTSGGKTTALRLGASAWGYPHDAGDGLVKAWDATPTAIERVAAFSSFLPLILDDTRRVREKEQGILQRIVYAVAQGQGRMRGTLAGLQRQVSWRTVLLTTGEERLTDIATAGGAAARILSVWGSPFGGEGPELAQLARATSAELCEHYGHLGPRLVRWLLEHGDEVRGEYKAALGLWGAKAGGNAVTERAVAYVALLDVALGILARLGVPLDLTHDPLVEAWRAVQVASVAADTETRALHAVYEWAASTEEHFYGRHGSTYDGQEKLDRVPSGGWLGVWPKVDSFDYIGIIPDRLDEALRRRGFTPATIRRAWADRGWLRRNDEHTTVKVRVGSGRSAPLVRVVAITRQALEVTGAVEVAATQQALPMRSETWE